MLRLFTYLIAILYCGAVLGEPLQSRPYFTSLSTKDGLSQDTVNQLMIDHAGFLWIASEGGLERWDGYQLNRIEGKQKQLVDAPIYSIFQDSRQTVWIGTASDGVYTYNLDTLALTPLIRKNFAGQDDWVQYASNFFEEPDGAILISLNEEVGRYNPDTQTYATLASLSETQVEAGESIRYVYRFKDEILVASNYALYAIVSDNDNSALVKINHLQGNTVTRDNVNVKMLHADRAGNLWVGTVEGLYRLDTRAVERFIHGERRSPVASEEVLANRNIWQIVPEDDGSFWLGTDIGLMRLTRRDGRWQTEHILEPTDGREEFSRKDLLSIVRDRNKNLWMGTMVGGALYWSPQSLHFSMVQNLTGQPKKLSNNTVWSIQQTDDDHLWIGTENGLNYYSFDTGTSESFMEVHEKSLKALDMSTVINIIPGPQNKLYLETYDGLKEFDRQSHELGAFSLANEADKDKFDGFNYGSARDNSGRVYFIEDGFYRYNPVDKRIVQLPLPDNVFVPNMSASFIDSVPFYPHHIFLSTFGTLWMIDVETFEYKKLFSLPSEYHAQRFSPTSLVVNNGTLWVAFPGYGIVGLNADTFEKQFHFDKSVLLQSNVIYGLQLDKNGNIWFTSHSGLHRFSPEQEIVSHYRYGLEIGVAEFNQGAELTLRDGRMAYGSPRGVILFSPDKLLSASETSLMAGNRMMAITGITLDSRPLKMPMDNLAGRHLDLQYDDYGLTIYYSPLQYTVTKDVSYRHVLMKNNEVLSDSVSTDSRVILPVLAPGKYRFEVYPIGQSADRIMLPAHITISVPYPPFRSPLAYTTYGILFIVGSWWFFYRRQRQIHRLHKAEYQVRLFGNAFRQTRDWVIIFDKDKHAVAANPAFENAFGLYRNEALEPQLTLLYRRYPKLQEQLQGRLSNIRPGEFWKDEDSIVMADGHQYDVLIDITAIQDSRAEASLHYLVVMSDISEQKTAERKLLKIANYDSLTGLVNRNLLLDRLDHAIANAERHDTKVAVLFVDLDRFKGINDSLGHDFGDKLLRVVANRMLNLASSTDTVARLGGDEFVIVMEEVPDPDRLSSFVSQLIENIETPISLGNEILRISCSIGVSFYPDDATAPSELLKQADVAMYTAKKDNLNAFTYFTEEMNTRARERLTIENVVKNAYRESLFYNHYQPIVNVQTGELEGVELLLRLDDHVHPMSPALFIPILEELRYIREVTQHAVRRAVEDLVIWYKAGFKGYVSVNLSALHFKTELDLTELIKALTEQGLPTSAIRFEITESVLMENTANASRQIARIGASGFKLALDDFGTGYSSLSYLKRFPLQVLKIDKSFIDDVNEGSAENALVLTTISLANSLNMVCIAEGVESREQAAFLMANGCCHLQGFYFSKPVNSDGITQLLGTDWRLK